jgi:fibronectin type 3 domain-containing protein
VTLAWDPPADPRITGYKVYVGTASGVYSTPIDVGNVTSYTLIGLTPGTVYYFVVTTYDSSGIESVFSNEVSGTSP